MADLANPRLIATHTVGGLTPHNFWVDETRAILFVAWYGLGVRAIDVSGPLSGELIGEGLELASYSPIGPEGRAIFWSPQLHRGAVWATDQRNGLWSFDFTLN